MRARSGGLFVVLTLLLTVWEASLVRAHEGHDHGAPPPPVSTTIAPRADASSDDFEVVVVARGQNLAIHVDRFRTNEPVEGASIEIHTPAGALTPQPVAKEPGTYAVAAPFLAQAGRYDLAITVSASDVVDILAATLVIPEPSIAQYRTAPASWLGTPATAEDLRRHLVQTTDSLWLYLAIGFLAGLLAAAFVRLRGLPKGGAVILAMLAMHSLGATAALADTASTGDGRDAAQRFPDGALFVPKPTQRLLAIRTVFTEVREHGRVIELPGRVVPNPNASGLVQTSVGGRLFPPYGGFKPLGTRVKAGDVLAFVRPPLPLADATAQALQSRELDQQISIVTRKVERLRSIREIIAKSQLEDAELELKGLIARRAKLDRAMAEPEPLIAPVDGVLAAANAVSGQMAEPNAVIFQIIDPDRLWIEALSYEAPPVVREARGLLPDGRTTVLSHVGTGLADRNQAVPVHFAIDSGSAGLRAGQFVTVLAETVETRRGIALPREAVIRASNGLLLVFEHTNAERFVPREVRIEPLDGARVLIVAGIEPKRRIVTQGAELLNQVR